jgi:hypothetical protein
MKKIIQSTHFCKSFPLFSLLIFMSFGSCLVAQNATVFGTVIENSTNQPIEYVNVGCQETGQSKETNISGDYALGVPANRKLTLVIRRVGYKEVRINLEAMSPGTQKRYDVTMISSTDQNTTVITTDRMKDNGMVREKMTEFKLLPSATSNLESILPYIALGTNMGTGGELSSQYQVRGGNYDENLVYVNDFEIYRPQLIRSGQQEGLSFPNPDLIRDLTFSSGGFEARYGDKMSSVLDVAYKRPDSFRVSAVASLLGASAHVEGSKKLDTLGYRKFRYLLGARYKTTQLLLGSLDTKGEYTPVFGDVQAYLTYDLNRNWQMGLMGNYNTSVYNFVPVSRSTAAGLINFAFEARTLFQGQERDEFTNGMGGVSFTYLPDRKKNPYTLKFLASRYQNRETEGFDIIGDYILGEKSTNLGSDNAGTLVSIFGSGTQQQYIRDYLYSSVTNIEHKGAYELQQYHANRSVTSSHFFQWGAKIQAEDISDRINEWERLDSALYSLPRDPNRLLVSSVLKTRNELSSLRYSGFLEDTYTWKRDSVGELRISGGVRGSYSNLNKEPIVTPRIQLSYKPATKGNYLSYRLSAGLYYQPPFYREMRRLDGTVNTELRAQKSAHIVGGFSYDFFAGQTRRIPFKLIVEAYYKKQWDLVSYDVDNVRVRYSGENNAVGYTQGIDMRLNGEFVPGAESWINLSFLQAKEKLNGIQHRERVLGDTASTLVDYVSRPTDQFFTLSMFFQDYLPKNKNFKMHLGLTFGSGLPFGLPNNNIVYRNTYTYESYKRVDIGFSYQIWNRDWLAKKPNHPLRFTRNTWASLEVFNMMDISNEASKTWLKTIYNTQLAVPNYLTSRRINLKIRMEF